MAHRTRPGSLSSSTDITLERVLLHDHFTPNSAFGVLLTPSTSSEAHAVLSKDEPFFKMALEINPVSAKDCSAILQLDLQPSDVVLNRAVIDQVGAQLLSTSPCLPPSSTLAPLILSPVSIFTSPMRKSREDSRQFQELESEAINQLQGLTDDALATVDEVLKKKEKKLRVKINAFAPNIVIPEVPSPFPLPFKLS